MTYNQEESNDQSSPMLTEGDEVQESMKENNQKATREISKKENSWEWIDNDNKEVKNVFGFNANVELVNGRLAMISFLLLILSELLYKGEPVTRKLFGIN